MKLYKYLALISTAITITSFSLFSQSQSPSHERNTQSQINTKVAQFVDEFFKTEKLSSHEDCRDRVGDCMDTACRLLGQYGCDDKYEVDEVLVWCRGNFDGGCITTVCNHLGQYGCDDRYEVQEIARACIGNFGGDCVESVCKRLGQYGCDDRYEVLDVVKKCAGNLY